MHPTFACFIYSLSLLQYAQCTLKKVSMHVWTHLHLLCAAWAKNRADKIALSKLPCDITGCTVMLAIGFNIVYSMEAKNCRGNTTQWVNYRNKLFNWAKAINAFQLIHTNRRVSVCFPLDLDCSLDALCAVRCVPWSHVYSSPVFCFVRYRLVCMIVYNGFYHCEHHFVTSHINGKFTKYAYMYRERERTPIPFQWVKAGRIWPFPLIDFTSVALELLDYIICAFVWCSNCTATTMRRTLFFLLTKENPVVWIYLGNRDSDQDWSVQTMNEITKWNAWYAPVVQP